MTTVNGAVGHFEKVSYENTKIGHLDNQEVSERANSSLRSTVSLISSQKDDYNMNIKCQSLKVILCKCN